MPTFGDAKERKTMSDFRHAVLYKKTSTGAIQKWQIDAGATIDGRGFIITHFGQVDGKIQTTTDFIEEGKNIGRSNETTPAQQAEAEAQAKWEKQLKKGYVKSIDAAKKGDTDTSIEGGVLPMLAKKYSEDAKKIKFPALVQRKLDGIRCIAVIENGKCTLWSRTRKQITGIPHIERELERMFPGKTLTLDGEAYNHDFKADFEKIVSFVRQQTPAAGHEVVQYHVYDKIEDNVNHVRSDWIEAHINGSEIVKCLETAFVSNEDELMTLFAQYRGEGYEGAMVRNRAGLYVNKRSADLQKVKAFDDAEFKIIGISEGRGRLQGHVGAFLCQMEDGKTFEAKMSGDTAKLKEYFENHGLWKGQILTVQYQGLTGANGVPRFPVGLRIRKGE
jgi:DNA ligase-1